MMGSTPKLVIRQRCCSGFTSTDTGFLKESEDDSQRSLGEERIGFSGKRNWRLMKKGEQY
jgi:hypothetical protein